MALSSLAQYWSGQQHAALVGAFTLSILLFFVTILCWFLKFSAKKQSLLPPSPPRIPIIGNLHQLGTLVHRSLRDLSLKYGPIMLLFLGHSPTVIVSSAEMAAEIMKNHDIIFANRPLPTAAKALLYGCKDIGFAPYGEYWRQLKKICVLELLSVTRVESFKYVREEETDVVIRQIRSSSLVGDSVDLSKMVYSISNNVVSRCALGVKNDGNRFRNVSRQIMQLMGHFSFGDFFPSLGWMDHLTGLMGKLRKASKELDEFYDQVIDEHIVQNAHNVEKTDNKDLVDILLHVQKSNPDLARDNIKAIIMDMFIGGSDTSATLMEWVMAELIRNPKEMKKVQEEVRGVVGKNPKVEEQDVSKMDYLKCIVKETLRLHPSIPTLVPRLSTKCVEIQGYVIPSNTIVYINAWAIQRDPKLWDKAEQFYPERFLNNSIDFQGQDFRLIPFGSGRRRCPGMLFGVAVVEFALANLLYWFDWKLPDDAIMEELDMTEAFGLTVTKKNHLHAVPVPYVP